MKNVNERSDAGASRTMEGIFNIQIVSTSNRKVVGEMHVQPDQMRADGTVDGAVVLAFGDQLARHAASRELRPDQTASTIESRATFLGACRTRRLVGEAQALHRVANVSIWRVHVRDAGTRRVAEITQSFLLDTDDHHVSEDTLVGPTAEADSGRISSLAGDDGASLSDVALERRKQIFKGACDVIAKKGFANAAVRDIAAAAGMPVPTMYQYINSKEDLLFFIYEYFMSDINERVAAVVKPGQSPTQNLTNAIRADVQSNDRYHRYIKLMFQETRSLNARGRERVNEFDGAHIDLLKQILEEGVANGEFEIDDADFTANLIIFICAIWTLRYWRIGDRGVDVVTESISRFVLRAVSTTAAEPVLPA